LQVDHHSKRRVVGATLYCRRVPQTRVFRTHALLGAGLPRRSHAGGDHRNREVSVCKGGRVAGRRAVHPPHHWRRHQNQLDRGICTGNGTPGDCENGKRRAEPKADRQSAANGISSIVTPISHPPISAPEIRDPPGARALDERRVRCGSRRWC